MTSRARSGPTDAYARGLIACARLALPDPPTPEGVLALVSDISGYSEAELRGLSRHPSLVRARQAAIWLLHHHCGLSEPEAGRLLARDQTNVRHALAVIDAALAEGART